MNKDMNLGVLSMQLQALETETFEVKDYVETSEMLVVGCSTSACSPFTSTCS